MTVATIVGAIVLTLVAFWPVRNLLGFYYMSDYGIVDTTKWNFFKEKLWVEFTLIPIFAIGWWFLVGQHIHISIG